MTQQQAIDSVGFQLGKDYCYVILTMFVFFFICVAWFTIVMKNRKFVTG
jgi:uncharacterized membrane protein